MEIPEYLTVHDEYVHFAPVGRVTRAEAVAMISGVIAFCRRQKYRFLLADITRLTGFKPPLIGTRFWIVREWAERSGGDVDIAMVALAEYIDPDKFGVIVMSNADVRADIFTLEEEARAWLLTGDPDDGAGERSELPP
ncbi:MAG TPA: hypothetical protein VIU41_09035 [Geobacteraceae bacterium]